MDGIGEIKENVRPGEACAQFRLREADAAQRIEVVLFVRSLLVEEAVTVGQSVPAQLPLEVADRLGIGRAIVRRGQEFEPDHVLPQSAQAQHPLQRHGEIAAAFAILRGKGAAEEYGHD
ncbi:MAG: hypothetical protein ABIR29_01340 [Chthoniobacterales bacterium]